MSYYKLIRQVSYSDGNLKRKFSNFKTRDSLITVRCASS